MDLCQTHCKQVPDLVRCVAVSCGHDTCFKSITNKNWLLPVPTYGSTWVVLWLFCQSVVVRLHSEIDQIHLSIEAQCVTTLLPLGDCHTQKESVSTMTEYTQDLVKVVKNRISLVSIIKGSDTATLKKVPMDLLVKGMY